MKRLISHDATRVLLHILAYMGTELDWRLISAIMHLLSKLGPKGKFLTCVLYGLLHFCVMFRLYTFLRNGCVVLFVFKKVFQA